MPNTVFLKASLALWTRRARFREGRLKVALAHHDMQRAAKWKRQLEAAQSMIAMRRRQLDPPKPIAANGVDVSNHQPNIDWVKVKKAGYRFAWIKAGEGDWHDPVFLDHVRKAKAAGVKVGGYHFLRPKQGRTGAQEARFFIARLHEAGLGRGDLRPVADIEATTLSDSATEQYTWDFLTELAAAGFKPLLYTYPSFGNGRWSDRFTRWPLWLADYSGPLNIPKPWTSVVCHQHADDGAVPGITGKVDLNRTNDLGRLIA